MKNTQRRRPLRRLPGMSLIEIIVVLAIIGIIAAGISVAVIPALGQAKVDQAKLDIDNIKRALDTYYVRKGKYPDSSAGLKAVVDAKVLENTPKDPWGNDFVYSVESGKPVVSSYGADGVPGGEGNDADISSKNLKGDGKT